MPNDTAVKTASSIGYSDSYSFDEAFRNALEQLPPPPDPYPDQLLVTRVVAVGSEEGGIAGLSRLYVQLVRLPDPITGSIETYAADEGEIPFPVGKIPPHLCRIAPFPWTGLGGIDLPFPLALAQDAGAATPKRVYSVDHVKVDVLESRPPQFVISACGQANSTGWGPGHIQPIPSKTPPEDGIYDFEFVAIPPSGIVGWAMTPVVTARPLVWRPDDGSEVEGIRVFAKSNEATVTIGEEGKARPIKTGMFEDGPPGL